LPSAPPLSTLPMRSTRSVVGDSLVANHEPVCKWHNGTTIPYACSCHSWRRDLCYILCHKRSKTRMRAGADPIQYSNAFSYVYCCLQWEWPLHRHHVSNRSISPVYDAFRPTPRSTLTGFDCALNTGNVAEMQRNIDVLSASCENFGFTVSTKKTEVLYQPMLFVYTASHCSQYPTLCVRDLDCRPLYQRHAKKLRQRWKQIVKLLSEVTQRLS